MAFAVLVGLVLVLALSTVAFALDARSARRTVRVLEEQLAAPALAREGREVAARALAAQLPPAEVANDLRATIYIPLARPANDTKREGA